MHPDLALITGLFRPAFFHSIHLFLLFIVHEFSHVPKVNLQHLGQLGKPFRGLDHLRLNQDQEFRSSHASVGAPEKTPKDRNVRKERHAVAGKTARIPD